MNTNSFLTPAAHARFQVTLHRLPGAPPFTCRSPTAFRSYLKPLALAQQRVLATFNVNRRLENLAMPAANDETFCRVEAETVALEEVTTLILTTALQQIAQARKRVESAL